MEKLILDLIDKGHIGLLNAVRYFTKKKKIGLKEAKDFVASKVGTPAERLAAGKTFHQFYLDDFESPYHIDPEIQAQMYVEAFENKVKNFINTHAKSKNNFEPNNSGDSPKV